MLKKETIETLRKILREEFGKDLPVEKVVEMGEALVKFFEFLGEIYYSNVEKNKNEIYHLKNQKK